MKQLIMLGFLTLFSFSAYPAHKSLTELFPQTKLGIKTKQGILREEGGALYIGNKELVESGEYFGFSLSHAFNLDDTEVIIVGLNSGGTACPMTYRFLFVDNDSSVFSREVGTCSDLVRVKQVGSTLYMENFWDDGSSLFSIHDHQVVTIWD
ncbi:hypothetical protein [Vibrio misgurnus]|uniref:hypothetical protein n=1 Tax=Vibrio misgurnus TaxID=2993714 RepID=UPI002417D0C7|nr:hypothetical protein [Vibrio sp. gvc]